MIRKQIPNFVTLGNLACGCVGIAFANAGNLWGAALMVVLAAVFDFFDGFVARLLNVKSEIGAQLDSLADMVSFGVLPAFIAHNLFIIAAIDESWARLYFLNGANSPALLVFVFALSGCYRLANFNVSTDQTTSFKGLPIPAAGLYLASFALIYRFGPFNYSFIEPYVTSTWAILISAILLSVLMLVPVRLLSLKISSFGIKGNEFRILLILGSIALAVFFGFLAIQLIVLLYFILSIIQNLTEK